ncbi:MAG: hypothetical protein JWO57_419 [Pseudonocardiales bacterium]|jgi:hypothetical protein|nr:hypothetical protein [Pseudonocardiales bacterium]
MSEIAAGKWTIEVSEFEPSTFAVELKPDGSVSGERRANGHGGTVSGTWSFTDPVLRLDLSSQAGLNPQPVKYEIRLSDASHGRDDEGHRFALRKG